MAAKTRLAVVLAGLNPAAGILDTGDGSGCHASKAAKKTADSLLAANPVGTSSTGTEILDRASKFDKLDKDKTGRLTRE